MRKDASSGLQPAHQDISPDLRTQLQAAADMPDEQINRDDPDAPEVLDWSKAVRGKFYRPVKKLKSLRIDADVLAFFEEGGPGYQTRINRALRASMLRALRLRQRQDTTKAARPRPQAEGQG